MDKKNLSNKIVISFFGLKLVFALVIVLIMWGLAIVTDSSIINDYNMSRELTYGVYPFYFIIDIIISAYYYLILFLIWVFALPWIITKTVFNIHLNKSVISKKISIDTSINARIKVMLIYGIIFGVLCVLTSILTYCVIPKYTTAVLMFEIPGSIISIISFYIIKPKNK